jgi:hypothetical protein
VDFPAEISEVETNLRADEAGGTGDEEFFHESVKFGAWSREPEDWNGKL